VAEDGQPAAAGAPIGDGGYGLCFLHCFFAWSLSAFSIVFLLGLFLLAIGVVGGHGGSSSVKK
jgi:hypothetical protein